MKLCDFGMDFDAFRNADLAINDKVRADPAQLIYAKVTDVRGRCNKAGLAFKAGLELVFNRLLTAQRISIKQIHRSGPVGQNRCLGRIFVPWKSAGGPSWQRLAARGVFDGEGRLLPLPQPGPVDRAVAGDLC